MRSTTPATAYPMERTNKTLVAVLLAIVGSGVLLLSSSIFGLGNAIDPAVASSVPQGFATSLSGSGVVPTDDEVVSANANDEDDDDVDPYLEKGIVRIELSSLEKDTSLVASFQNEDSRLNALRNRTEELVREAFSKLSNGVRCIPKKCDSEARFYRALTPSELYRKKLYLVSYPGSGNTWLRAVVRSGTRRFTGSMFRDGSLARGGFRGEMLDPGDPKTRIVKSHYPFHTNAKTFPHLWAGGGIHVVRAPFDAMMAEATRLVGSSHTAAAKEGAILQRLVRMQQKRRVVELWRDFFTFWTRNARKFTDPSQRIRIDPAPFDKSDQARKLQFPVATLYYEDFSRDFVGTVVHLFSFIKAWLQDEQQPVEDAVVCALRDAELGERFHRNSTKKANAFRREPLASRIEEFCKTLEPFWDAERWGPCDGTVQRERKDVPIRPRPRVGHLPFCEDD
ncbi:WSC domain-containing protein 1 [Hondaea fermentalgiana]|uniref:WSC domain-containing protein 1 n=1 Tax=Hondaea fermentalgiana TaxID=2315210 RepID=A0A2R5G2C7_9STRA|nr:WSC domain-containing protein 1 [Hondaea fermentalgiana]|eukprot:GBG24685.1 WSC domain-containing protein 1 [Hondaea fermentalgiana]